MGTEKQEEDISVTDGRGPGYPVISLEKAVERANKIRDAGVARSAMPLAGFLKIWGYQSPSGPARRQIAALRHYGLLEYGGNGKDRKIRLSDLALKIILDKVPDSVSRANALREAALKPPIFLRMLETFPFGLGTDAGIETYLTLTEGYSDDAAKTVMNVFRDTMRYSGLDKTDNMSSYQEIDENEESKSQNSVSESNSSFSGLSQSAKSEIKSSLGERELAQGLLSKDSAFRLIVRGYVGVKEIEMLIKKLELDKEILADREDTETSGI